MTEDIRINLIATNIGREALREALAEVRRKPAPPAESLIQQIKFNQLMKPIQSVG